MNRQYPKVSIITPSYNQAQYIEKTILSVTTQAYPNIEYIIIDGGSTDGSVDIIKKYQDKLAYWVSEPDNGQSDALNKGFKRATGDIVAWINSDDVYIEGAIPKVVQFFNEHPEVDMIYGNCDMIDTEGKVLIYLRAPEFDLKKQVRTNIIPQPSVFMKRKMLEELGYLDESLRYAMDYDLWLSAGKRYNIKHIDALLSCFRFHDSSKTVSQTGKFLPERYRVLNNFFSSLMDKKSFVYPQYIAHLSELMLELQDSDIQVFANCILGEGVSVNEVQILKSLFTGWQVSQENVNNVITILQRGYQDLYIKFISPCGQIDDLINKLVDTQLLHLSQRLFMEGHTKESIRLLQMVIKSDIGVIMNPLTLSLAINYLLTMNGVRLIDSIKHSGRLQIRKAWIYVNHLGGHL